MDQVTQTKILFRREQWKKIIAECQESGLPVKTWCDQHGFKEQSYYYYLKKIREQEIKNFLLQISIIFPCFIVPNRFNNATTN